MSCTQVFDLTTDGLRQIWVVPMIGLVLVIFSGGCVMIMRHTPRVWFAWLLVLITTTFTTLAVALPLKTYFTHRNALASGVYDIVEGPVERFKAMPPGGHDYERFTVRGEDFVYSEYDNSPFFHTSALNGGPIREGVYVRVFHVNRNIIHVEVCTSSDAVR